MIGQHGGMAEKGLEAVVRGFAGTRHAACPAGAQGALASLVGDAMSRRYCAWRGASERRYVVSVYPVDPDAADVGLPTFDGFVLIAVANDDGNRRILRVSAVERAQDRAVALARGLACGTEEWHVYLVAETGLQRAAIASDLERRHLPAGR